MVLTPFRMVPRGHAVQTLLLAEMDHQDVEVELFAVCDEEIVHVDQ